MPEYDPINQCPTCGRGPHKCERSTVLAIEHSVVTLMMAVQIETLRTMQGTNDIALQHAKNIADGTIEPSVRTQAEPGRGEQSVGLDQASSQNHRRSG